LALASGLASAPIPSGPATTLLGSVTLQPALLLATLPQARPQSARVSSSVPPVFVAIYSVPMQPRRVVTIGSFELSIRDYTKQNDPDQRLQSVRGD
jgi:hypothetical protein